MLDAEQTEMAYRLAQGISFADFGDAMEALREVGPGGHYLGTAHTRARFQDAFFMPELLDNNSFEQWQAEGAKDAAQRANVLWKKTLAEYEPPPLDLAIDEALKDFIRRKKESMPDAFT